MAIYIRVRLRGAIGSCPPFAGLSDFTHQLESVNHDILLVCLG